MTRSGRISFSSTVGASLTPAAGKGIALWQFGQKEVHGRGIESYEKGGERVERPYR